MSRRAATALLGLSAVAYLLGRNCTAGPAVAWMIAVVAPTIEQARLYAAEDSLGQQGRDWVAVTRLDHARSHRFTLVKSYGETWLMRDYYAIMASVQAGLR